MIIDFISDLHGHYPKLEGGDLLIVAGDLTARDTVKEHNEFCEWLDAQPYQKKVVIAGNHDGKICPEAIECNRNCVYLCNSGTEFEGLKIWGSPWTPEFYDWHFMKKRGTELAEVWDKIPSHTDILITHGPPFGMLDYSERKVHCGCKDLWARINQLNLKLHVYGHIHEDYGQMEEGYGYISVNASIMNASYYPVNKPIRVIL